MCKLISKCCVCGTVYAVTKCTIRGQSSDAEKVSHGYCSNKCQKFAEVQLLVWKPEMGETGFHVLDAGYMSGDTLYYKGDRVKAYITLSNTSVYGVDEDMLFYSPSKREALDWAKTESKSFNIPVVIM